jgi:hypothetical protein
MPHKAQPQFLSGLKRVILEGIFLLFGEEILGLLEQPLKILILGG